MKAYGLVPLYQRCFMLGSEKGTLPTLGLPQF